MKVLQPAHWPRAKGYANGIAARGEMIFIAGQIGWDESETIVSDHIAEQARQALLNTLAVLAEAGARAEHIVRMTWYVTSKAEYLAARQQLGSVWRDTIGKHFPTMTLVEVNALVEDAAKVEIESTAVIPD